RWIDEDSRRPFDLAVEPAFRATLVRMAEAEHVLLMSTHRIAFDAACIAILGREVASRYEAHRAGGADDPPPLPIQIVDYAIWESIAFSADVLDRAAAFWRHALDGVPRSFAITPGRAAAPP